MLETYTRDNIKVITFTLQNHMQTPQPQKKKKKPKLKQQFKETMKCYILIY